MSNRIPRRKPRSSMYDEIIKPPDASVEEILQTVFIGQAEAEERVALLETSQGKHVIS